MTPHIKGSLSAFRLSEGENDGISHLNITENPRNISATSDSLISFMPQYSVEKHFAKSDLEQSVDVLISARVSVLL